MGHKWDLDILIKIKLYLLDSDDIDFSHGRELNQSENFTLVKDGVIFIKIYTHGS